MGCGQMIRNFKDKATEAVFQGEPVRHLPPDIQRPARRKLLIIDAATTLDDCRNPPGNRLHALQGDRQGTYAIRINDQWRVTFRWSDGDAFDVCIEDYH